MHLYNNIHPASWMLVHISMVKEACTFKFFIHIPVIYIPTEAAQATRHAR